MRHNMRATQFSVSGLFGIFDHKIPLKTSDRITIIHGPNGFGKTVFLRMIDDIFHGRYSRLAHTPFDEFCINFDERREELRVKNLLFNGSDDSRKKESDAELEVSFGHTPRRPEIFRYVPTEISRNFVPNLEIIEHLLPELERISGRSWRHLPTDEVLVLEEVIERFGEEVHLRDYLPHSKGKPVEPEWLRSVRDSIHVRFIETQRLLSLTSTTRSRAVGRLPRGTQAVTAYSEELSKSIQTKLVEYAALSQSLDRTFPVRVVSQNAASDLTTDELRRRLNNLEHKRESLMETGLLDPEGVDFQVPQEFDERKQGVLSVYVEDAEQKLGVFDEMAAKIDLLKRIINERFLYKRMTVSKDKGFSFSGANGKPLPVTGLSSGEQHELVLMYELLFRVDPGSLILIDEPELSLHVAWQEAFLRDLLAIANLRDFDVVIATHSPQIINDRWDLTVELRGPSV
jgi:predicted ATP-binding protein involved in virulence